VSGQPPLWHTVITLASIFRHSASMEFATVNDENEPTGVVQCVAIFGMLSML
jgi:hypothetical protein